MSRSSKTSKTTKATAPKRTRKKKPADDPDMAAPKKANLFTTIGALSSQRPLTYRDIREAGWPYQQFMINRAFSLSRDTVMLAQQMNLRQHISQDMHATFYIKTVPPRRRFETWPKEWNDERARTIARYYGMSTREARQLVDLHTEDQYAEMQRVLGEDGRYTR